jgi:hypothetical protein
MSSIAKSNISLSKKDLVKNRTAPIASRNVVFYHKATAGSLSINLLALVMPSAELPTQTQATLHEINSAKLISNKKNLRLRSVSKGELVQGLDYVVTSSYDIQLIGIYEGVGTEPDEIFEGVISSTPVSDLVVASAKSITKTYELPVGQTTLNLGNEYKVGVNPNDNIGIIKVFVNGVLAIRDTDYQEVDSGNGYGTTIEFLAAPITLPYQVVVDYGVMSITDNNSIGAIESLAGSLKKISDDLADLAGTSSSDYFNASPSEVERRAFGDKVLELDEKFDTDLPLSQYTKTKWQRKTLPVSVNTSGPIAAYTYNNLSVGNTYKLTIHSNFSLPPSGFTSARLDFTHNAALLISSRADMTDPGNAHNNVNGTSIVFVATGTTLTASFDQLGGGQLNGLSSFTILEELPNHEQTTQWN